MCSMSKLFSVNIQRMAFDKKINSVKCVPLHDGLSFVGMIISIIRLVWMLGFQLIFSVKQHLWPHNSFNPPQYLNIFPVS